MLVGFWCTSLFVFHIIFDESTIELRLKIKCAMRLFTAQACRPFGMAACDRLLLQLTPDACLFFDVMVRGPSIKWGVLRSPESRRCFVVDTSRT